MGYDSIDDLVLSGADITGPEMDVEFKILYDSLLAYKNYIFHLVDAISCDCEAGERLAMNIAERDSSLLQQLVAKECDSRRMVRKAGVESSLEQRLEDGVQSIPVEQILKIRGASLRDAPNDN
ncbi:hypothetical protein HN807_03640 [Candidatus Bathyarchaeota archaeon]|nr:hypothetical protein [Candidatus Bathyarchaeota archaeon]MBT6605890.1 hypothetical protein [Candidatus Bathyarchaeota archaeon]MBT7187101.1 hypothetical protein [Candidatus Bathyarchaeota archaeon]MBT7346158.1 hypothetical protein [Candidatus Bathyarchaeota archaeon]